MIKAIIFDAFGTLIDTKDGSVTATEAILKKNHSDLDPKEVYGKWKKHHARHISELSTFVNEDEIFLRGLKNLYDDFHIKGNPEEDVTIMLQSHYNRDAFPDTAEVITKLRAKYKVYIGSNTDTEPLIANMKRNNIVVDEYFTSEALQLYKPEKDFFLHILQQIGCKADEAIYVGDSQVDDILGATSACIPTVWVNRKGQILQEGIPKPSYEISNLNELFSFL